MNNAKHRTQISLEPWQYEILMEQSRKTRKSLARIIREMIAEKFAGNKADREKDPIMGIIGMGSGDGTSIARKHDAVLYPKGRSK
jgi:hypothetical protein